jgi:hypothetical protein
MRGPDRKASCCAFPAAAGSKTGVSSGTMELPSLKASFIRWLNIREFVVAVCVYGDGRLDVLPGM